jgi:hypothetical protein
MVIYKGVIRRQRVRINGFLRGEGVIKHGVPQGSVMGPILFLTSMIYVMVILMELSHPLLTIQHFVMF